MTSDTTIKVCIKTKQYTRAFKESGLENKSDFNTSIGLMSNCDEYMPCHSFVRIEELEANKRYKPYIIRGGIPLGSYEELIVVDEKLFDYSKIKYEFYNE